MFVDNLFKQHAPNDMLISILHNVICGLAIWNKFNDYMWTKDLNNISPLLCKFIDSLASPPLIMGGDKMYLIEIFGRSCLDFL